MSWLEWFGESVSPGSMGSTECGGRDRDERPRWQTMIYFFVAAAVLLGWGYLLCQAFEPLTLSAIVFSALGTLLYLVFGYFVHIKPDSENIGWCGGLIDNPFRISDDINRFGLVLHVLLWPGRFVSEAVVDGFGLFLCFYPGGKR